MSASVWRCDNGHVLGVVVRVKRNRKREQRLLLYRHAVNLGETPVDQDGDVDVIAVIEGFVMDVRCSICEGVSTWRSGKGGSTPQNGGRYRTASRPAPTGGMEVKDEARAVR